MRRFLSALVLTLVATSIQAMDYRICSIDIKVSLQEDGSALLEEVWDIFAGTGTEWYLVKDNLDQIEISDFEVFEGGKALENVGKWDVGKSRREKQGLCGVVSKRNGCELCWGIGDYGYHVFTVRYRMSNVVEGLDDADLFHLQLVSPGLSTRPEKVRVRIEGPTGISAENSRIWGFGFKGSVNWKDGAVVMESSETFRSNSSVIALILFNKGFFKPTTHRNTGYEEVLEKALEGSTYADSDDREGILLPILTSIFSILFSIWVVRVVVRANIKQVLGCNLKDVEWCRDIPFDGNIEKSSAVLEKLGEKGRENVAAAMILRMIERGQITVGHDSRDRIELSFNDNASFRECTQSEQELYNMMKEASGSDWILQHNEFRSWSRRHYKKVSKWADGIYAVGVNHTPEAKEQARKLMGLKKFLSDFTLMEEKGASEVALWKDYLVFGALFGIAEKVAVQLKEINPEAFKDIMYGNDYQSTYNTIMLTRMMASHITNARMTQQMSSGGARGGFGGASSFGGGGGFHGGGFGGGGR